MGMALLLLPLQQPLVFPAPEQQQENGKPKAEGEYKRLLCYLYLLTHRYENEVSEITFIINLELVSKQGEEPYN
jgi:hypothetical protein